VYSFPVMRSRDESLESPNMETSEVVETEMNVVYAQKYKFYTGYFIVLPAK